MLSPYLNTTVKVQRRTATSRNSLNEPSYGAEGSYPVAYASMWARLEFVDKTLQWTPTGERDVPSQLYMYFEPDYTIKIEDRITVLTSDSTPLIGVLFLVTSVSPEWDAMGNVSHYVAELSVH